MKADRNLPTAVITKKGREFIESGHVWVYAEEITKIDDNIPNGSFVDVVDAKQRYIGTGLLSLNSKIRLRLISRNANDRFDSDFFARRVSYAYEYRKQVVPGEDAFRLIFGEADHFPGLTVDIFSDVAVTQTLSFAMEQLKPTIFPLISDILAKDGRKLRGIYERNDAALRELEGLSQGKGWFGSDGGETFTHIKENGIKYRVDFQNGQKTGYFLDQKFTRREIARLARGKNVLDCFTHTGSFALNAVYGGAETVAAVDISEDALASARENARLNGMESKVDFMAADVFDLLPELEKSGKRRYNFIILDPPAFTKSRKTVENASRGYKEINLRAIKLLPRGGYLATCSCSHFMGGAELMKIIAEAAREAGVSLRLIETMAQAPDHPVLVGVPETEYLKFFIFQIV